MKIELYAIRRDGYNTDLVKSLIRHGVLIPIAVTIPDVTPTPIDETPVDEVPSVPDVDWTGGSKR